MSKNFELLRQIGNDEELFQTAMLPQDGVTAAETEPNSALDQETFENLMEKASLVGLFQTSNEPPQQTLSADAEVSLYPAVDSRTRISPNDSPADTFRMSTNPAHPIGEVEKTAESRVKQGAVKGVSLPKSLPAATKPMESARKVRQEAVSDTKRKVRLRISDKRSLVFSWVDSIKDAAKAWEWKGWERGNHYGADLEAITRDEGIKLVQRVFPGVSEDSPRVALFTGLENEAGCASTCARAAEILAARAEGPVCIVDANFRAPSLHEYFGVENLKGLAEATVESGPVQNFAQQIPEPDLWLIPSGKASGQLRFPRMADGLRVRIEELRDTFKYVIIHSGPLRLESSAMLLSRWTDGVVLVLEANATRRDAARRAKEMLAAASVSVLGVVLNNRTFPIPESIYRRL